jgi:hypothetical protein
MAPRPQGKACVYACIDQSEILDCSATKSPRDAASPDCVANRAVPGLKDATCKFYLVKKCIESFGVLALLAKVSMVAI